jgi:hypothetical protein
VEHRFSGSSLLWPIGAVASERANDPEDGIDAIDVSSIAPDGYRMRLKPLILLIKPVVGLFLRLRYPMRQGRCCNGFVSLAHQSSALPPLSCMTEAKRSFNAKHLMGLFWRIRIAERRSRNDYGTHPGAATL